MKYFGTILEQLMLKLCLFLPIYFIAHISSKIVTNKSKGFITIQSHFFDQK